MLATESLVMPDASRMLARLPMVDAKGRAKKQVATVDCPKSMVGRVIGKNGETIRALQNYSGALIQIDQTVDPMKVTISGAPESLAVAVSMVTDIVNGTFKGFAMLRQIANSGEGGGDALCQPVYAPGYGLIPPSQVCNTQFNSVGLAPQLTQVPCSNLRNSPVSPIGMALAMDSQQDDHSAADIILGLTNSIAQLSVDSGSQTGSMSGVQPDAFLASSGLSTGFQTGYSNGVPASSSSGLPMSHVGMGISKPAPMKPANQFGTIGMAQQSAHVLTGDSRPGSADFQAFHAGHQLGLSSPMLEHSMEAGLGPYQTPKQSRSVAAMRAYSTPPQQSEPMYPAPPARTVSPQGSDSSQQGGCVRLRDPNGRSFFLNLTTGQTQWASDVESADSFYLPQ